MSELQEELKRSLGLIGRLDSHATEATNQLHVLLQQIQLNGHDPQTAREISSALDQIMFSRINSAAEAAYIENTVLYMETQIRHEMSKLRDPAFKYAVPEDNKTQLSSSSSKKKKVVLTYNAQEDEPRYCLCNDISYGEMIACDNPRCKVEWFHLPCVGLTTAPVTGKWFCPTCRKKRR